ncbi:MAG: AMP-dependent synthetase/ligase [Syntrophomonadales bacterium]|jgi:long-chain acyl-CoA synthetase
MALKVVPDTDFRIQWLDLWHDYIHTVPQMFYHSVKHHGNRNAHIYWKDDHWVNLSYQDLSVIAEEIAAGLIGLGVKKGDNLVIMSPNCAEWGWADMGIELAGGCTTTIFPSLGKDDVAYIINHSQVSYVFAGNPNISAMINSLRSELPTLKGIICFHGLESGNGKDLFTLDDIRTAGREFLAKGTTVVKERIATITPDDAATTVYTSGTTGKLKAVRLSHGEVTGGLWRCLRNQMMGNIGFITEDVYLSVMPMAHIMERTYGMFCVMAVGACLAWGRGPTMVIQDMQEIKPTFMVMVPRMMDRILKGLRQIFAATPEGAATWDWAIDVAMRAVDARMGEDGTFDMSLDFLDELTGEIREEYIKAKEAVFDKVHAAMGGRLRCFASGGAAILPELHKPFLGMGFFVANGYGLTETLCGVAVGRATSVKVSWNAPIAPGLEWRQDDDGELLLKGVGIIKEYYNDPESNRVSFTDDGFFRTGDIVEFDEHGIMRVVDRKKEIIVMDTGKNVAPAKLESLIMQNILIDQVLILGDGKKYIAALICPNWDEIIRLCDTKDIKYEKDQLRHEIVNGLSVCVEVGPDLASNEFVNQIVAETVKSANQELADFEQIKKFKIPRRKFLQRLDELTPTSKTKRRVISVNFAADIDSLYQD